MKLVAIFGPELATLSQDSFSRTAEIGPPKEPLHLVITVHCGVTELRTLGDCKVNELWIDGGLTE